MPLPGDRRRRWARPDRSALARQWIRQYQQRLGPGDAAASHADRIPDEL